MQIKQCLSIVSVFICDMWVCDRLSCFFVLNLKTTTIETCFCRFNKNRCKQNSLVYYLRGEKLLISKQIIDQENIYCQPKKCQQHSYVAKEIRLMRVLQKPQLSKTCMFTAINFLARVEIMTYKSSVSESFVGLVHDIFITVAD